MLLRNFLTIVLAGIGVLATVDKASGAFIISPRSGKINNGGPGLGSLRNTYDRSGLSIGFVSGVTDFDEYVSLDPIHTNDFRGFEWFSNPRITSASVTYDLGRTYIVDKLALWNEETSGIGRLNLSFSRDGVNFSPLASGLTPKDNRVPDYPVEVFSFSDKDTRYVRFDMSQCPQRRPGEFPGCAIGEVAFSAREVPEPATIFGTLAFSTLSGAWLKRRRKQQS